MCVCVCFPLNYFFKSTFPLGSMGPVYIYLLIYPSKSSRMHGAVNIQYPCHGLTHGFLVSPENSKLGGHLKVFIFYFKSRILGVSWSKLTLRICFRWVGKNHQHLKDWQVFAPLFWRGRPSVWGFATERSLIDEGKSPGAKPKTKF